MDNSILKTSNGSDSAFTYIIDPPPFHRLRQRGWRSILHRHRATSSVGEDGLERAQQDEVTRTSEEGVRLLDAQEVYLKNER